MRSGTIAKQNQIKVFNTSDNDIQLQIALKNSTLLL